MRSANQQSGQKASAMPVELSRHEGGGFVLHLWQDEGRLQKPTQGKPLLLA